MQSLELLESFFFLLFVSLAKNASHSARKELRPPYKRAVWTMAESMAIIRAPAPEKVNASSVERRVRLSGGMSRSLMMIVVDIASKLMHDGNKQTNATGKTVKTEQKQ